MDINSLNINYDEKKQLVVHLSGKDVTEICSFSDCGITPSSSFALNISDEKDRRDNLVHDYLLDADLLEIFGPTVTSSNPDVTSY